ncbi:MAG: LysM peptidoglycan-binding domain-containing protein, partial [Treponema sp.]
MEVISYVGFTSNRPSSFLRNAARHCTALFKKRGGRSGFGIKPERAFFSGRSAASPLRIRRPDTEKQTLQTPPLRNFHTPTGKTAAPAPKHTLSPFSIILPLCAACLGFSAAFTLSSYFNNHTGQLKLAPSAGNELEILNKTMQAFALDEAGEYSDDGTLTGALVSSAPFTQPVTFTTYKVQNGDTISGITKKFGLKNISTLIGVNDIANVRQLGAGQKLKIPSLDGLLYTVQAGNSLASLSAKFNVSLEELLDVNELDSETLTAGQQLFIPGAKLDSQKLQQALGTLFKMPIFARYRISSRFGYRADPFTGARTFHTGVDFACPQGTPVVSAASGTVSFVGYSNIFGNYIIVKHS